MTAVASPLTFQPSRIGWADGGKSYSYSNMNSDEASRPGMFSNNAPPARKTVQRQNSSSSLASNSSATSTNTLTAPSVQTNGTTPTGPEAGSWVNRKKPTRGLWPPGKAEPATGISTARPQPVSANSTGPTASSGLSAIQAPLIPTQQMAANGTAQTNGVRNHAPQAPPVILHLMPLNGTFERKTITVPYYPDVLRIGRQTNQKTIPTPLNGFFDSKVLSRQHAEIWADRDGLIFIRDVKSSNGTFVNGERLSPENRESEPKQLVEGALLELGIDIVSEDQKTVVHHKVSSKVEHAGYYGQNNDPLNFGDLDPSNGGQMVNGPSPLRRNGSQGSLAGRGGLNATLNQNIGGGGAISQQQHMRNWLNPISMEQIVKKLNAELKYAEQQSRDLERTKRALADMLTGTAEAPSKDASIQEPFKEPKHNSEKRPSPLKSSKSDLHAHFSLPPAPPPSVPLPAKPDVARALADPVIQPLLRRTDTARPGSETSSPTKIDHSGDILRLCEELKLAKGELSEQDHRMKGLEDALAKEKEAREVAENTAGKSDTHDWARKREGGEDEERKDSPRDSSDGEEGLRRQVERLTASMDEMKAQMEAFRQRAESAEHERDTAQKSLAEMVEEKRRRDEGRTSRSPSSARRSPKRRSSASRPASSGAQTDGSAAHAEAEETSTSLLTRAGIQHDRPISPEQAQQLTRLLAQEVLKADDRGGGVGGPATDWHGREAVSAATVVLVGVVVMGWLNGWTWVGVTEGKMR
ncbi:uncharacterized protein LTR77_009927 [Saxophila tyrrhenica]|uniref:FHA domain-containing protein n=1 Tax=Saxophila tyrrhenica TaxID=1690608 RepID=A0AAV9NX25_9PEZI|nr:hypothetical protein LTR77_009927 [Saxophila tyrrhenica]